jgi:hypothetical protein
MLKQFIVYITIILTITSCNIGAPKKPKNLISKAKMVNILIDAKLLGSATYINKSIMQQHGIEVDNYVFEKHGIDSLQFALSNEYYAYYIKDYEEIYNKAIDSLEKLKIVFKEQELKEKREKEKREKDSLNHLVKEKDSISIIKTRDSLQLKKKKDSLAEILLKKKNKIDEGVLISPVSETSSQPRK